MIDKIDLSDRSQIPQVGLGTWKLRGNTARKAVEEALEVGYRHIDTADFYGNHKQIAKAIFNSGISRKDLFITTKVWRRNLEKQEVIGSVKRFLEELELDYLDLVLIHWPNNRIPIEETLDAFEELRNLDLISDYGVSNFTINHLKPLIDKGYHIVNNQVELHPSFQQKELREFCHKNDISVTAYSPLGQGKDLKLVTITEIAEKHDYTRAQVIIRWLLEKGLIVIPRSSDSDHIKENFQAVNIELSNDEIQKIDNISDDDRMLSPGFAEFDY